MAHELSRLKREFPLWRIFESDGGHLWAAKGLPRLADLARRDHRGVLGGTASRSPAPGAGQRARHRWPGGQAR